MKTSPARLELHSNIQGRVQLDMIVIQEYAETMQNGGQFPPVQAISENGHLWVWDGFHRVMAAREAGVDIEVDARDGTFQEAQWLASGANKDHGLRRTNADKRRAVEIALKADAGKSNREIARHCGVTDPTVGNVRAGLESTAKISQSTTRTGADGRTINTANIGKPKPKTIDDIDAVAMATEAIEAGYSLTEEEWNKKPTSYTGYCHKQCYDNRVMTKGDVLEYGVYGVYICSGCGYAFPPRREPEQITESDLADLDKEDEEQLEHIPTKQHVAVAKFNRTNENIEWAAWSWNPVTGCNNTCEYCYARDIAKRFYPQGFKPTFHENRLSAPTNTKPIAPRWDGDVGHRGVFVCSMADLFGDWVPQSWIDAVIDVVRNTPQWNFIFLTKNPKRLVSINWPTNAWVGTTVDTQARVIEAQRAFALFNAPVKFLSCEPMLEQLEFSQLNIFDWVIIGGRSKNSKLPEFQPEFDWVLNLTMQAKNAECKVYWKTNLSVRPREYPV